MKPTWLTEFDWWGAPVGCCWARAFGNNYYKKAIKNPNDTLNFSL